MRKISILPLALVALSFGKIEWKPLFDGHSFKGWHILGDQSTWALGATKNPPDSAIIGFSNNPQGTQYSMVFSDDSTFDQFTVKYKYRLKAGCSGFFFRSQQNTSAELVAGCQVEAKFESNIENQFGNIYCWPTNEWQTKTTQAFWKAAAKPIDQYQEVVLTIKNPYAYVNMNGMQAVGANATERAAGANDVWNYTAARTFADKPGRFALQIHNGQKTMDVAFKDIAILTGCGDASKPGFDGAFVAGLPEQPAVYKDNNTCTSTSTHAAQKTDLNLFFGNMAIQSGKLGLEITYPGSHSLDIINVHGKTVFSGSAPAAHTYEVTKKLDAGIYIVKLHAGNAAASRKILVP